MVKEGEERSKLERLSVKELRRQAALHDVQLTQIAAAVEKSDLVNLILKAGPVKDTYDVSLGVKVHTAETIAKLSTMPKRKKKHKKRQSSSSSSSGSSSSSRGKRKKRRSHKRSRSRPKKRERARSRSRSPSVQIMPTAVAVPQQARAKVSQPGKTRAKAKAPLKALPPPIVEVGAAGAASVEAPAGEKPTVAQAGVAAAAALGFNVLPKAPSHAPLAPAAGLRPSVNTKPGAQTPYGAIMLGSRICVMYLCHTRCDLGERCPDAHVMDPEEEMRVRARFKEQECHYGASCNRPGCLFRHPGERFEEGQFIPESQQVTLKPTPAGLQVTYR